MYAHALYTEQLISLFWSSSDIWARSLPDLSSDPTSLASAPYIYLEMHTFLFT